MPAYSKEKQKYHLERVRAALVVRPNASSYEIQKVLKESSEAPLELDRHYIDRLQKKIFIERAKRLERSHLNLRLATIQDKKARVDLLLWSEATNQENPGVVRVMALRELFKNELDLLQSEMDAGVFERHLGTLRREPPPLTPEQRERILRAMINWGIVKPKPNESNADPAQNRLLASG